MHAYAHSNDAGSGQDGAGPSRRRGCRGLPWRPTEIVAMVLGFIVFWPIGLAVLLMKVWQRNAGHQGHLADFARERWEVGFPARMWAKWGDSGMWNCRHQRSEHSARDWRGFGSRSTGNSAFDDWRTAELARLEEERRKLAAAEQEFANYMEGLRRARDREEFDRFMNQRRSSPPPADPAARQTAN